MPLRADQHATGEQCQLVHQPGADQRRRNGAAAFAEDAGEAFGGEGLEGGL